MPHNFFRCCRRTKHSSNSLRKHYCGDANLCKLQRVLQPDTHHIFSERFLQYKRSDTYTGQLDYRELNFQFS